MKRIALLLPSAVLAAAVLAAPASAAVKLSYVTTKPATLVGSDDPTRQYDGDETVWAQCGKGATPLTVGWSGASAAIATVYANQLGDGRIGFATTKPMRSGKIRGHALCAKGAVGATVKLGASGATRVSCPRGKLALGVPIVFGPYWDHALTSKPDGARGWSDDEGGYGRATAICVAASAFGAVQRVHKGASLKAGHVTASVALACKGGRRPISWGFEAGLMNQNTWISREFDGRVAVPYVATSKPRGTAGWSLTFATPDGAAARTATHVALHLTCAIPR